MRLTYTLDDLSKTLTLTFSTSQFQHQISGLRHEIFELLNSSPIQESKWEILAMDLTDVQSIDSSGLNLIISLIRKAQERSNKKIIATISNPHIEKTLRFTRLNHEMEIRYPSQST